MTPSDGAPVALADRRRRWSLVWSERPRLLRIARRRTASEQDAEDVVAEALLRAMECPDLDEARLPGWLTTVTIHLCIDAQRERAREKRLWSRTGPPAAAASCEERVCELSEAAWVSRRLTALPERQAQALRLRADGHDVSGVARSLGVSYRTAESLLARGRAAARTWLVCSLAALIALAARWGRLIRIPAVGRAVAVSACVAGVGVAVVTHAVVPHGARPPRPAAVRPEASPSPAAIPPGTDRARAAATRHPAARSSVAPAASPGATAAATSGVAGVAAPAAPVAVTPAVPAAGIAPPAQRAPALPRIVTAPPRLPEPPSLPGRQPARGGPGLGSSVP